VVLALDVVIMLAALALNWHRQARMVPIGLFLTPSGPRADSGLRTLNEACFFPCAAYSCVVA
jgi:hypothetical protein